MSFVPTINTGAPPHGCSPDEFSFWLAANLPLGDRERLALLGASSAVSRLQLAIGHLEKMSLICCRVCGSAISHAKHLFSMSSSGIMGTYVNPGGHIHQMTTTFEAHGLHTSGDEPCSQDSWFPGYVYFLPGGREGEEPTLYFVFCRVLPCSH